jgi:hypothetical protein
MVAADIVELTRQLLLPLHGDTEQLESTHWSARYRSG